MLIDIDIKIADNSGNLVHHFEKRFDDADTACLEQLKNDYGGESFDNFLSEYMSFSGHAVKEKLISGHAADINTNGSLSSVTTDPLEKEAVTAAVDGNIEYQISIGNKPVFARTISYSQIPAFTDTSDSSVSSQNGEPGLFSQKQELGTGEGTLDYAIQKAIAKYEANLTPISDDELYPSQEAEQQKDFS